mmetsp:Transcript_41511/g.99461  ORF Transcript_41511/g.99461 Transcript_41511/m.99461 type:complete len:203 (-) Transcript_41511:519-1127(-)
MAASTTSRSSHRSSDASWRLRGIFRQYAMMTSLSPPNGPGRNRCRSWKLCTKSGRTAHASTTSRSCRKLISHFRSNSVLDGNVFDFVNACRMNSFDFWSDDGNVDQYRRASFPTKFNSIVSRRSRDDDEEEESVDDTVDAVTDRTLLLLLPLLLPLLLLLSLSMMTVVEGVLGGRGCCFNRLDYATILLSTYLRYEFGFVCI